MIVLAITGAIALYYLINRLMKYFVEMGSKEIIENAEDRVKFIRSLIFLPLILGHHFNYFIEFTSSGHYKLNSPNLWIFDYSFRI